jgi:hypothetical protein
MNINEKILLQLINDPALMKKLEKMAKTSIVEQKKEKKQKQLGLARYVNKVVCPCKLCKTETVRYARMDWDNEEKLHRIGCYHQDNIWPELEEITITQRRVSCNSCSTALANENKEDLIKKLISLAEKF